jgi:hypothetical protein
VIDAVVGPQNAFVIQDLPSPTPQDAELPDAPPPPTATEVVDFARAVMAAPVREVNAVPGSSDSGWTGGVAHHMESLASHLKALAPGHQPSDSAPPAERPAGPEVNSKDATANAVAQMERAYMIAIETTMASRGSTEATKIFNTLLKGQ